MGFYTAVPGYTEAYHKDSSNNEYFGRTSRGALTSSARWQIYKIEYTGSNWLIKWPNGDDSPKYIWDSVESYTYELLKDIK